MDLVGLINKYSKSGPRYTSYPTAPQFHEKIGVEKYSEILKSTNVSVEEPLALYIHLPFCEALCYYCG
jgi:oxygen-independent coproporphyrinogen-3 oxidase